MNIIMPIIVAFQKKMIVGYLLKHTLLQTKITQKSYTYQESPKQLKVFQFFPFNILRYFSTKPTLWKFGGYCIQKFSRKTYELFQYPLEECLTLFSRIFGFEIPHSTKLCLLLQDNLAFIFFHHAILIYMVYISYICMQYKYTYMSFVLYTYAFHISYIYI